MAHDVFVSYAAEDKPTADAVAFTLEARHVRCWIAPRDVLPGEDYAGALIRAINESRLLVLVFSSKTNESTHVVRELERAASKGIPILPLRIEDVPLSPSIEYFISRTHWLDAITPPLKQHLDRLADTAAQLLSRTGAEGVVGGEQPAPASQPSAEAAPVGTVRAPGPLGASLTGWLGRPMVRLALGIGAILAVTVIVLVALLSGGDNGPSLATLAQTPRQGNPTIAPSTPTVEPSTPTAVSSTPTVVPSPPTGAQDASEAGPAPPMGQAGEYAIVASPECVAPGGRLEATWTAIERKSGDIIALFPAAARNDEYSQHEWNHVSTTGGRIVYPAPSTPGGYEFRLLRSGSHLAVSNPITVQDGCPAGATTAQLEGYSATASPECVEPGGRLEATWTATERESGDLIALFPAAGRNDKYTEYEWNYTSAEGGAVVYPAPSSPGEYEFRLLRGGTHLAVSQPIIVSNSC